ncbi:putative tRNA pseudouridine synthase Pus10 [Armadillidium vulgare]|nr:putative tRNA pseudouridine synthase Pus10 [Armadillidium vulgare]
MESEITNYLSEIGCCWRCILLYLGYSKQEYFSSNHNSNLETEILNGETVDVKEKTLESSLASNMTNKMDIISASVCKKLRVSVCISCLGLLQTCESTEVIKKLSDAVREGDFDAKSFSLGLSLPLSLPFRIHLIWAHFLKKFSNLQVEETRRNHVGVLKDIWRSLVGPQISSNIDKEYVSGQLVDFNLVVQTDHPDSEEESLLLVKIDDQKLKLRQKQTRKYSEGLLTNQFIKDTLGEISDEKVLQIFPDPPSVPNEQFFFKQITCTHASLYLAGRYNKYSRTLPQTPWFVSEDRRFNSSVQELICEPLKKSIRSEGYKFSSSGREDVDVRCLGRGRPFVIEFTNPHRIHFNDGFYAKFFRKKKDTSNLKEGEDEKTKSYCALCFCTKNIPPEALENLQTMKRSGSRSNDSIASLFLNTQAGTYIKEFVHGDFGRTTPNLGSILGAKCDIIALDVENVQLDWPPSLNERLKT